MPILPFKLNQDRRHHIPRQRHKVTNSLGALLRSRPAYDASLRQRGSLTVWFTDDAIAGWAAEPRTTRGGQPWYSSLAILTALTLRAVFHLAYRQAKGLLGSVIGLLGLALPVPDHTTLSRRAATLEVPPPGNAGAGAGSEPTHLLVDSTGLKLCGKGEWGVVQLRVTRKTRNPLTTKALSIFGVTWKWHFLSHASACNAAVSRFASSSRSPRSAKPTSSSRSMQASSVSVTTPGCCSATSFTRYFNFAIRPPSPCEPAPYPDRTSLPRICMLSTLFRDEAPQHADTHSGNTGRERWCATPKTRSHSRPSPSSGSA